MDYGTPIDWKDEEPGADFMNEKVKEAQEALEQAEMLFRSAERSYVRTVESGADDETCHRAAARRAAAGDKLHSAKVNAAAICKLHGLDVNRPMVHLRQGRSISDRGGRG